MYFLNGTNSTNDSSFSTCETPRTISTFEEFTTCYLYFYYQYQIKSILQIILFSGTILANFTVVICVLLKKHISIFDQIIVGHGIDLNFYKEILQLIFLLSYVRHRDRLRRTRCDQGHVHSTTYQL